MLMFIPTLIAPRLVHVQFPAIIIVVILPEVALIELVAELDTLSILKAKLPLHVILNAPANTTKRLVPGPMVNVPFITQLSEKVTVDVTEETLTEPIPKAFGHCLPLLVSVIVLLALVDIAPDPLIPIEEAKVTEQAVAAVVLPTVMALVMVIVFV